MPEGQEMQNAITDSWLRPRRTPEPPEGWLQGGWKTSQRPQSDMSMGDIYFPHELDEGYPTPEHRSQAERELYGGKEPTAKPTVPGYAPYPHGSVFQ